MLGEIATLRKLRRSFDLLLGVEAPSCLRPVRAVVDVNRCCGDLPFLRLQRDPGGCVASEDLDVGARRRYREVAVGRCPSDLRRRIALCPKCVS